MAFYPDQVQADLATILVTGEFATAVTYTPKGGSGQSINALVFGVDRDEADDEHGTDQINRRRVAIMTDAVNGIASPAVGDEVTISGVSWRVESIEAEGFGKAVLSLVGGAAVSKHHDTHKRRF